MSTTRNFLAASITLGTLALAGSAHAQTTVVVTDTETAPVYTAHEHGHYHRDPGWHRPRLTYGIEGGLGSFVEDGPFGFGNGTGSAVGTGPAWGARVGVEFLPFIAVEAHYLGMYNQGNARVNSAGNVGLVTNSGALLLRLTAPLPYVHPYVFGGVGYYDTRVTGTESARQVSTLNNSAEWGIPMGVGVDVPVCRNMSVGVEGTFHLLMGESFSSTEEFEGGDPFTTTMVLRGRL